MGWKDAPIVQVGGGGKSKWQEAPLEAGGAAAASAGTPEYAADSDKFKALAAAASPHNNPSLGDTLNAFQAGAHQGMTLGFGDEINAGLQTVPRAIGDALSGRGVDVGRAYEEGLKDTQAYLDERTSKAPNAAMLGELTGGVVTGGTLAKGGLTLMKPEMSVPSAVVRGGAEGAAYGGVSGLGNSDAENLGERVGDALEGAYWGAGTGGALNGIAAKAAGAGAKGPAPTVADLETQAGALYDKARNSGFIFTTPQVNQVADDIAAKAISEGLDPTLHPGATAALKRLQDAKGRGMTVGDAQTIRRVLNAARKDPTNPDQARIAGQMIEQFDQMTSSVPELAKANSIYHQAKKGELIEQAIELAGSRAGQFSGSGFENALRTEFRALQRQIIKGDLKGLTQSEIDAINKVANGGNVENALRWLGKFAPTGVVPAMGVGMIADQLTLGGLGSLGLAGAGAAGRVGATAMTKGNAISAALTARNGGVPVPRRQLTPQQLAVAQALIAGGGSQAGQVPFRLPDITMAR